MIFPRHIKTPNTHHRTIEEITDVTPESVIDTKTPLAVQDWDEEKTLNFHVQFINAGVASKLLGIQEVQTPVNEALYELCDIPFFTRYLEVEEDDDKEESVEDLTFEGLDINENVASNGNRNGKDEGLR